MSENVTDARRGHFYMYDDIIDDYGKELGAFGVAMYTMLCRRAGKNGSSHPSLRRMADDLGISERQAKRELKKLRDLGLISIRPRRNEQGRQMSSEYTILDAPKAKKKPEDTQSPGPEPEASETPVGEGSVSPPLKDYPQSKDYEEEESLRSSSSSAATENGGPPESKDSEKTKPEYPGAFCVRELMDRVNAARKRGADIHDPPEPQNYGRFFKVRIKRHEIETLLYVLDYLVAKAAGEINNEPKAWCGFDTALDAVLAGWRPKPALRLVGNPVKPEDDEEWNEIMRAQAEIIAEATSGR